MKSGNTNSTKNLPLICVAAVVVCVAAAVLLFRGKNQEDESLYMADRERTNIVQNGEAGITQGNETGTDQGSQVGARQTQEIENGESLVIPLNEVTEKAQFYPVSVDGTEMEVLAVRDSAGEVRTAFNTCQSCYSSGYGYYVQEGNELVCQNCGNRFTMDQVQVEASGCNPYPIFDGDKTIIENTLLISYDFLKDSKELFEAWKI